MKRITYTKADGSTRNRDIIVIAEPRSNILAIDLTEFNEEEKDYYSAEFVRLREDYLEAVRKLGLGSCYRQFKPEGVEYL